MQIMRTPPATIIPSKNRPSGRFYMLYILHFGLKKVNPKSCGTISGFW